MKRWLKRITIGAVVIGLAGWLTLTLMLRQWTAKPPPMSAKTTPAKNR